MKKVGEVYKTDVRGEVRTVYTPAFKKEISFAGVNLYAGTPRPMPKELGDLKFEGLRADDIVKEMRDKLAGVFGVTVIGPNVTLRWNNGKKGLIQVSMLVTSITDDSILEEIDDEDK